MLVPLDHIETRHIREQDATEVYSSRDQLLLATPQSKMNTSDDARLRAISQQFFYMSFAFACFDLALLLD